MTLSETEILVILVCAALGWVIVSRFMAAGNSTPHITADTPWHEALRVTPDASEEAIEAAYQQRMQELDEPLTMATMSEQSARFELKQHLQRARDQGLAAARSRG